jgi:predicted ATPase/class 3 adenylate cyclase
MMRAMTAQAGLLPSGTVTLLFSDVEGSTQLLGRLGDAYADALDTMRTALRDAWSQHGGVEMGTEGDSFFVVFESAPAAVTAAIDAQRALAEARWADGDPMRVRMGVHTGSPIIHDGGYVGMDVHRAARIASAAHGGQVVVSAAVAELAGRSLADGAMLTNLGLHHLKDIALPERLFQVTGDGLHAEFPPLRTLGQTASLPTTDSHLVGREGEIAELSALLQATDIRLITLTGPGGSGKTRLSIGLAESISAVTGRFPDGVFFVPLAEVTDGGGAWGKLADALSLPALARTPPSLFAELAQRQALLILDNLEQMAGADDMVAHLMEQAPRMTVVATSRHPLHIRPEHEHPVPPLQLPVDTGIASAQRSGAVQLFMQYARQVRPSLQLTDENAGDVAAICRRLDGLPLALELAAARIKVLSPKALLARLDGALDIKTAGGHVPSRQHTLRETIDWSYALLGPTHQAVFRQLGVFAGGAALDAIGAVADLPAAADHDRLDVLTELVDASLVVASETADGEPRFSLLETIRVYARETLEAAGELDAARLRHARHFLAVAELLRAKADTRAYTVVGLEFGPDADNVREALAFTTEPRADDPNAAECATIGLRLATATRMFWSDLDEALMWMERAVTHPSVRESEPLVFGLAQLAFAYLPLAEWRPAVDAARHAAQMARRLGATRGEALALQGLAQAELRAKDFDSARRHLDRALELARADHDNVRIAPIYDVLGLVESYAGGESRAAEYHRLALEAAEEVGFSRGSAGYRQNVAVCLRIMGRTEEAFEQMSALIDEMVRSYSVDPPVPFVEDLACILADRGMPRAAARLFGAADAARVQMHWPIDEQQAEEISAPLTHAQSALSPEDWDLEFEAGRQTPIDDALRRVRDVPD